MPWIPQDPAFEYEQSLVEPPFPETKISTCQDSTTRTKVLRLYVWSSPYPGTREPRKFDLLLDAQYWRALAELLVDAADEYEKE